jgi:anti-sigma factor RsiW
VPHHPDHEQLAAFQAGDGDRRQRTDVEAHLAGCPSCAEVVASVKQARSRLARLEEPALPPGLHHRLAAAIEEEAAAAQPTTRPGRRPAPAPHARPTPWYRRPVAWGAAAALLLAALVVPFLDQSGGDLTTAGGGGSDTALQQGQVAGAGRLPLFRIPGEVSAATVQSKLDADSQAKAALDSATAGRGGQAAPRDNHDAPSTPQATPEDSGEAYRSRASTSPAALTADLPACLPAAAAAADPASRPLVPAFYIEGTHQGSPATILVTTSTGQPGRVDLWVFPRNDCSSSPLATERVR